jgi:DnaJ-class molecular chaperone
MFKNYYEILETSRNASIEVIEKSYITLAKKYYPDSNNFSSDSNETMKGIDEAYDVL